MAYYFNKRQRRVKLSSSRTILSSFPSDTLRQFLNDRVLRGESALGEKLWLTELLQVVGAGRREDVLLKIVFMVRAFAIGLWLIEYHKWTTG